MSHSDVGSKLNVWGGGGGGVICNFAKKGGGGGSAPSSDAYVTYSSKWYYLDIDLLYL